jgi:outer membrane protein assembly factor BamA
MPMWKIYFGVVVCLCSGFLSFAQPSAPDTNTVRQLAHASNPKASYVIGEIIITGNKRNKDYIIDRELPFKSGDSVQLPELVKKFEIARQQLVNTRLFIEAIVAIQSVRGYFVDVIIDVKERWYIFPIPYVKPVDRNLSEWAKQGYGSDRLNYGFKFTHYNVSGRNDKLRLWLITGYSKQIQFQYDQPYADKSLKHGYKISFAYVANKEFNYATINNQQQFSDSLGGIKNWSGSVEWNYRPGLRTFHTVRLGYTHLSIDKAVLGANPKYYKGSVNNIDLPEISYTLRHFNVDYIPYPLSGWMGEASLTKRGIHSYTDMWQLAGKLTKATDLGKKWSFSWETKGVLRVPFDQPFYNSMMFGYQDMYLRGLEKYVVDGVAGVMSKQTIRKELFHFNVPTFISSGAHARIPFKVYAKAYADAGYSHNKVAPQNSLTNRMLYTTGFGLDVVTFYDFIFRFDYSFNQLGQNGLFLHFKNEF